jgi:hypothetical protein
MARIAITPGWIEILDFRTRFPSAWNSSSGLRRRAPAMR